MDFLLTDRRQPDVLEQLRKEPLFWLFPSHETPHSDFWRKKRSSKQRQTTTVKWKSGRSW